MVELHLKIETAYYPFNPGMVRGAVNKWGQSENTVVFTVAPFSKLLYFYSDPFILIR